MFFQKHANVFQPVDNSLFKKALQLKGWENLVVEAGYGILEA